MTVRKTIALAAFTFIAGVLTTAGVFGLLAGEPAQAQTPTPTSTARAPTPGPTSTPTPTPTLAQRVAANTSSIQFIDRELVEQGNRIATLETQHTRHTWDCAVLLAEYDAEIADWADNQFVTAAEADALAIGAVKTHMNRADRNAHWQTTWYDAGVKAELFKCGLRTISMFR